MTAHVAAVYARHASDQFNCRLHQALGRLSDEVSQALNGNLVALVLGGGYGRGEGGVVRANGVECPYNDIDLTVIAKQKRAAALKSLPAIGEQYSQELQVDVDFGRPITLRDVEHWPRWLMWFDLLHGHVVLSGPTDVLTAHAPVVLRDPLPAIEATRLLLNRGAGLLWAIRVDRKLERPRDRDFVRRNYYKCALALGDALLIAYRRFSTPQAGRGERFGQLAADVPQVAALGLTDTYADALRFKLEPDRLPAAAPGPSLLSEMAGRWATVFLHVEESRTGRRWPNLEHYAQWCGVREQDQNTPGRWPRNIARNLQLGTCSWRYPREALLRRLPVLLAPSSSPARDWGEATARFLAAWQKFN